MRMREETARPHRPPARSASRTVPSQERQLRAAPLAPASAVPNALCSPAPRPPPTANARSQPWAPRAPHGPASPRPRTGLPLPHRHPRVCAESHTEHRERCRPALGGKMGPGTTRAPGPPGPRPFRSVLYSTRWYFTGHKLLRYFDILKHGLITSGLRLSPTAAPPRHHGATCSPARATCLWRLPPLGDTQESLTPGYGAGLIWRFPGAP